MEGQPESPRRRFACSCLDWSERRSHLGGALGAALLEALLQRGWVGKALDSRALAVTRKGARQFPAFFGMHGQAAESALSQQP